MSLPRIRFVMLAACAMAACSSESEHKATSQNDASNDPLPAAGPPSTAADAESAPPSAAPALGPATVDATTFDDKLLFGYQGWFACDGDGSPIDQAGNGWRHWAPSATPTTQNVSVDMLPDVRALGANERCSTAMTLPDGSKAAVYSAWNRTTVTRHFSWMKDHGLDGVLLQEFVVELGPGTPDRAFRDGVTANVRAGAEQYGRTWAVEYDISGAQAGDIIPRIEDHWAALAANGSLSSGRYLHQGGLPVVEIWGLGFNDRPGTPAQANELIDWFTKNAPPNQRAFVIGGIPSRWRTQGDDCQQDPAWPAVWRRFDVLNPWLVGRYTNQTGAQQWRQNVMAPDIAEANRVGKRYLPVVWPGGRGMPRAGGRFWWTQFYEFKSAGPKTFFGAMFDEVDEATAMYEVAPDKSFIPPQVPTRGAFITLDADGETLPSDWYLRLAGEAGRVIRGEAPLGPDRPISP